MTPTPLTLIILAKNEERLIGRAIRSAAFVDEVVVLDSGSEDGTRRVAEDLGATVVDQPWLGWSNQRNRGAEAARNDWVLFIEADEIVSPELADSFSRVLGEHLDPTDGFTLDRRNDFLGALMHNDMRPTKRRSFVRMYNRTRSRWDPNDAVHERVILAGEPRPLEGPLLHWRGSSLDEMVATLNRYATVEADVLTRAGVQIGPVRLLTRPVLRFMWCFVWKRGYSRGTQGLLWALVQGVAEVVRHGKAWETQKQDRIGPPPPELVNGSRRAPSRS